MAVESNMYEFEIISLDSLSQKEYCDFENKSIFTTIEWLSFVAQDSGATPLIIRIEKNSIFIGYFTALAMKKFGVSIVASPFRGWSTCFMGFDVKDPTCKLEIMPSLLEYLFTRQKCMYFELVDRDISLENARGAGFKGEGVSTLELDLSPDETDLFKNFKTDARNFIRQFERRGATIEEARPDSAFASEYYDQLCDVFEKQGLLPTYNLKKVENLLAAMGNTDRLLCLRVRDPEGRSIATSIFLGYRKKFFFWGGASYREFQSYRPNEAMIWYAIRYWKKRGCEIFDMVGVRDYKRKFGPEEKEYAKITVSKYAILIGLRNMAEKVYFYILRIKKKIKTLEAVEK